MDILDEDGPDPFGLDVFLDAVVHIGEVDLAFALPGLHPEIVDGFVADDDEKPAFDMFVGGHAVAGVEEFVEGIGYDVFCVMFGLDDIGYKIGEWADQLVIDNAKRLLIPFAEGVHYSLFVVLDRLSCFGCLHAGVRIRIY